MKAGYDTSPMTAITVMASTPGWSTTNKWDDILSDSLDNNFCGYIPLPWHKLYRSNVALWISRYNNGKQADSTRFYSYTYYSPTFRIYNNISRATLWVSVDDYLKSVFLRNVRTGFSWEIAYDINGFSTLTRVDITDALRAYMETTDTFQLEFYVDNTRLFYTGIIAYMSYDYGEPITYTYNFTGTQDRKITMPFFPTIPGATLRSLFGPNLYYAIGYDDKIGWVGSLNINSPLTGVLGDRVRTYGVRLLFSALPGVRTTTGYPIYEQRYLDFRNNNLLHFGSVNCNVWFSPPDNHPDDYPNNKVLGSMTAQWSDADGGGYSCPVDSVYPRYYYYSEPQLITNGLPWHLDINCYLSSLSSMGAMPGEPVYYELTNREREILNSHPVPEPLDTSEIIAQLRHLKEIELLPGVDNTPAWWFAMRPKIEGSNKALPENLSMGAYPSPFNSELSITVSLPVDDNLLVTVHDINGHLITILYDKETSAGTIGLIWNGTNDIGIGASSGIYLITAKTSKSSAQARVILIK